MTGNHLSHYQIEGSLRNTHLQAHLKTYVLLNDKQIKLYDELRGYDTG